MRRDRRLSRGMVLFQSWRSWGVAWLFHVQGQLSNQSGERKPRVALYGDLRATAWGAETIGVRNAVAVDDFARLLPAVPRLSRQRQQPNVMLVERVVELHGRPPFARRRSQM